jgi:hypothetical protein
VDCRVQRRLHEGDQLRAEGGGWNIGHRRLPRESCRLADQSDRCASVTLNRGNPRLHVARKSAVEAVKAEADCYAVNVIPIIREASAAAEVTAGMFAFPAGGLWGPKVLAGAGS